MNHNHRAILDGWQSLRILISWGNFVLRLFPNHLILLIESPIRDVIDNTQHLAISFLFASHEQSRSLNVSLFVSVLQFSQFCRCIWLAVENVTHR
jgi:hypothetical protein